MLRHRGRSRSKQRSSQGDRRSTECSSGLVEDVAVDRVAIVQWDDVQAIKIPIPHDVGMHWFNFITTLTLKGVSEIMPIFGPAFVLVCHYAISKLCQGMCHHYGVRHVSPRLHIHRFRPWAPVRLPGVCFLTKCVATVRSVGAVSVRACVRPRPSQNGPR